MKPWLAITLLLISMAGLIDSALSLPTPIIIGHAGLSTHQLPLNQARSIFSMRLRQWPDGQPIHVDDVVD